MKTEQYLTFAVAGEEYGWPLLRTEEILEAGQITRVPASPDWMKGVMGSRGTVLPVIDLAAKLGLGTASPAGACILVVEVAHPDGPVRVGVMVDRVDRALDLGPSDIGPAPTFGTGLEAGLLRGLVYDGHRNVRLLDVDRALAL